MRVLRAASPTTLYNPKSCPTNGVHLKDRQTLLLIWKYWRQWNLVRYMVYWHHI